ncbi:Sugar phosphate isomerase/epimerase [Paenibacillus algorifonticola]|uniref:Sugar phosphate isomerase/epimerase n=1 Tax=Paenibacillus algorifonticola TaxID=684063 RepID=A0A1I2CG56_9BACL|nr:sugar phosphate isomerase/epimerase [Paenibacillus algorifonticola]SFE67105.1 Sugar phosphate isomerase/epimerase [Paenibacillus algorifonticola]
MSLEIGLQLFSAKTEFARDRAGTLNKIAEIGYKNIEIPLDFTGQDLFKLGDLKASDLKQLVDQAGLNVIATHIFVSDDAQIADVIAFNKELGCTKTIIPISFFTNYEDVLAFSEKLNRYGSQMREQGISLLYHNHFHEFQKFNGSYALDIILEHTSPENVGFELDTYWALRGGVDVISYIEKLGSRCEFIHQKDLPASVNPVNLFETLDENEPVTMGTFMSIGSPDVFTEIGEGSIDIAGILQATQKHTSTKYIIVEQDATNKGELESIEISYKALTKLLAEL